MIQATFPQTPSNKAYYIREKIPKGYWTKYKITPAERREIYQKCGSTALLIFEMFVEVCSYEKPPARITDQDIARHFGMSVHTAKKNRLKLFKSGFLAKDYEVSRATGNRTYYYYVGSQAVKQLNGGD